VEIQLDYWGKSTVSEKVKSSLKQAFKILHVQRLPPSGEPPGQNLSIFYMTKEKKQKSEYDSAAAAPTNPLHYEQCATHTRPFNRCFLIPSLTCLWILHS
jgi:hypothetical protein